MISDLAIFFIFNQKLKAYVIQLNLIFHIIDFQGVEFKDKGFLKLLKAPILQLCLYLWETTQKD